jgi:hypothetical protein
MYLNKVNRGNLCCFKIYASTTRPRAGAARALVHEDSNSAAPAALTPRNTTWSPLSALVSLESQAEVGAPPQAHGKHGYEQHRGARGTYAAPRGRDRDELDERAHGLLRPRGLVHAELRVDLDLGLVATAGNRLRLCATRSGSVLSFERHIMVVSPSLNRLLRRDAAAFLAVIDGSICQTASSPREHAFYDAQHPTIHASARNLARFACAASPRMATFEMREQREHL